ncbi:MFS transporter [Tuanshanicoccus lijuaniae]|uniref:MFS transporter n=1 Tax=Aerococcaceae bacterium zg-1292 TaxID=2774330 RepID=UPI0019362EE4|nr:MFS transporter [Aerococcaceae bacterium zg-1292]MBF6978203.1 MFS transporter [Aerococcaceae bacterium zg-BR22]MBS4456421.1 glycoside-pentoside-hexuronide (GPH):cation symporter [Aerococcaceae bacterium zg-A91]MBS4458271.1 glycoside-pentoside-hexuronide (GPH):cation symporter [Aerococcaceae bacterium zg-BR33]QQA37497.1 MFS transporter [Aerococcaceae bacterium zg-1292]
MEKRIKKSPGELEYWLYSTGNFANTLLFLMVGTYINFFYTDILGISPIMAGTIFMVARLVDAITDPLMGMIIDKTNSRWGKFRPYIIAGAPPLGIIFVMLFYAPDFSPEGKVAYAFVTYIIYSLAWTVVQIPQLALPAILTNDIAKRTRIQAIFQAFGSLGSLVITSFALPILNSLGGEKDPKAWVVFTSIVGFISVVIFILSANSVKNIDRMEQYNNVSRKRKITLKETLSVITKNKALICILIAYGTDMFAAQIANAMRIYFFRYNMNGRTDLITYIGYVQLVAGFAMVLFVQPLVKVFGKKWSIFVIEALAIIFILPQLLTGLSGKYSITSVMFTYFMIALTWALTNLLSRSAVLDAANYAQMKTDIDGTALVNSTFTFVNKACQALSAFLGGWVLQTVGYNKDLTQQSDDTLVAILLLCTVLPIIGYVCSLVSMYFYPMNRKDEVELERYMDNHRHISNNTEDLMI